jgi:hypothetical protein
MKLKNRLSLSALLCAVQYRHSAIIFDQLKTIEDEVSVSDIIAELVFWPNKVKGK